MKYLIIIILLTTVYSCKPCRECKYDTLKSTEVETFCSSIAADRKAFEERMDSTAKAEGSSVICTKESY